ncbi:MAG: pyruvate formate lyase family protein [Candidatus Lokiarchaeia archaeon]
MVKAAQDLKGKLIVKAVRNVRRGYTKDDATRGMFRPEIKLDLQRSRLITESYRMTDGEPMPIRRAKALDHILSNLKLYIQPWERIVGNHTEEPSGLFFPIDMNWRSVLRAVNSEDGKSLLDDKGREELEELCEYWDGKCMSDRHKNFFGGDLAKYWRYEGTFMWSQWSELGVPDYEKLFRVGLRGLIKEAGEKLEEIERTVPRDYIDQKEFLQAVLISLRAVIKFANRYAILAREMAEHEKDDDFRKRLLEIVETCEWVPENPPRTFLEALQFFFFIHLVRYVEYSTLGIGIRFDKVLGPYYKKDFAEGRITRDEALELLQLLWVKLHELGLVYSPLLTAIYGGVASLQAITLGGTDSEGKDVTNEVTFLVMDTALSMRSLEPSIALRIHDDTPDSVFEKAVDVIRTGIGYPSLFNDRAIVPLLQRWNVPLEDARTYSVTGCVYIEVPGKCMARRAMGGIALPKCLWWALHQGRNPKTGDQWGAPTPDPRTFKSAGDVLEAYLEQVRFFFDKQCKIVAANRELYEKYLPRPYYSAILDGCIEKGQDCRKWAYPSNSFCVMIGPTNVADSIAAIKKVVFEEKKVTMEELIEAMDNNWEGYEHIRQLMLQAPKYGNDDDYVDEIMAEVQLRTEEIVESCNDRFGHPCHGDGSGISATYGVAFDTPATPDGRFAGETFADATLSPVQGRDYKGPTAVLNSAAKIDMLHTYNHLMNQKFLPSYLEGDHKRIFIDYLKTWRELGIAHVQFNVVDKETLLDAQAHPEEYQDLIVRVAGYSAYFVDLSKGLQDTIIARTEQKF